MILITSKEMKKQLESARFRIKISKNLSLVVNLTEDHRRFWEYTQMKEINLDRRNVEMIQNLATAETANVLRDIVIVLQLEYTAQ